MSPILADAVYGYRGIAANESVSPTVAVAVGDAGVILYSQRVKEDENGIETFVFAQATRFSYETFNGVDFGGGRFIACANGGKIGYSSGGAMWSKVTSGTTQALNDICFVSSLVWVAVGGAGTIIRSVDNGNSWSAVASGVATDLLAVAVDGANLVAVGASGTVVMSDDAGATWSAITSGVSIDLNAVVWDDDISKWAIVGNAATVLTYDGGDPGSFETGSSPSDADFEGVAWAGAGGTLIAVGTGSATIESADGLSWSLRPSGATSSILWAVEYFDSRFIAVGAEGKVEYSPTGAGLVNFDKFKPVSEIYRSVAFARLSGYMLYLGMLEFVDGAWKYFSRRIRNPSPGTVDDFEGYDFGAYFSDLPGDGAIIAAASVEGGIVVGEQNQISLLTDGGSLVTPWDYHDNYGEGLQLISNLTTFGGAAFGICTDGLIYRADYNSVTRLQSFFDLTKFDDFNPGSERVSIQFDPATQKLVIFRPESPWVIYLCDDETGGVSEFHLPEFFDGHSSWVPRSVFVSQGEISGIKVGYATDDAPMEVLVTLDLQMDAGITGFDDSDVAPGAPFAGEIVTGCFRMTQLGARGDIREILVRTTCDPDATVRPRVAIGVKSEPEDDWRYSPQASGTFTADGVSGVVTGTNTALTNLIAESDGVTTDFEIPWLVEKITRAYTKHTITDVVTAASYTKIGAREIRLAAAIPALEALYVHGIGVPQVVGSDGDLIELSSGELHVIDTIDYASGATCSSLPFDYSGAVTYIPTKEMPVGDSYGDGKLTFGIAQGFDQLMLRFIMVAGIGGDAKFAKIKKIEIGYEPTGPELKTDS